MKVAFDEHVPIAVAKVFLSLAQERPLRRSSGDLTFHLARDYAPRITDADYIRKSDVPWVDRFAAAGGRAIISGDVKMRGKVHERLALYQHGFVVIFFERQWGEWNFFHKSGLIMHWWEEIVQKIRSAERSTFWVVPCEWPRRDGELRNVSLGLAQMLKDNPSRSKKVRARRRSAVPKERGDERQAAFLEMLDAEQKDGR